MLLVSFITMSLLSQNMKRVPKFHYCLLWLCFYTDLYSVLADAKLWENTQQYNLPLNKGVCSFPEMSFSFIMSRSLCSLGWIPLYTPHF